MVRQDAFECKVARNGLFAGDDPFAIAARWLDEAWKTEPNDANAMALATAEKGGLPNVRILLLKEIEPHGFVFYTNRESAKGSELAQNEQAALVLHWKSLRRQVRVRGMVEKVSAEQSDAYFNSRHPQSRAGAIASQQSRPLEHRETLVEATTAVRNAHGDAPPRPEHWGGYRILPVEIEFWADGEHRLHDRFRWTRDTPSSEDWNIARLYP